MVRKEKRGSINALTTLEISSFYYIIVKDKFPKVKDKVVDKEEYLIDQANRWDVSDDIHHMQIMHYI